MKPYKGFVLFLLVLSLFIVFNIYRLHRFSSKVVTRLLETRGFDIAVNLEFLLQDKGLKDKQLFKYILKSLRWPDLAYLALIKEDGTIILHSNPNLIGHKLNPSSIRDIFQTKHPRHFYQPLLTQEKVFVFDFPSHLHKQNKIQYVVLRVALHPYPALQVLKQARLQIGIMLFVLVLLWFLAIYVWHLWQKNLTLQHRMWQQKQLASLGEMAAILAHEIRNPLAKIKGFAQLHKEKLGEVILGKRALDAQLFIDVQMAFSIIIENVAQLECLANELLTFAREERFKEEEFDLSSLYQEVIEDLKYLSLWLEKKPCLSVDCPQPLYLKADRKKMKQVLINLLQNALEAIEKGGEIKLMAKKERTKTILSVCNNGPAISPSQQTKIFQPFFTTKAKGTGLGLAIAKRWVEAMGGKISVESYPEKTCFIIQL